MDSPQAEDNVTLEQALRRANLLAAAAEVSQNITRILDIDKLLPKTVDIICEAYDFYYAGVFLIDETGEFAVLRAGRGEPGRIMMENNHKLAVGGNSMIGACTALNEARISLDVDTERVWYPNPVLPETRSEMALPLAIGDRVIGAVTVQSVEASAFSNEDISSLQAMANQLAIAIENARQRRALEEAHQDLLRAKTFETIATATGDAIHWIGNKAEPIGSSVDRIRQDVQTMIYGAADLLAEVAVEVKDRPLAKQLLKDAAVIEEEQPDVVNTVRKLSDLSEEQLRRRLSLASTLEDLQIVDKAANLIMRVKEDLIGPAREQAPRPAMIQDVLKDALTSSPVPAETVTLNVAEELPLVVADPVQLNRVFVNVLKNAQEAMANQDAPEIHVSIRPTENNEFVQVNITDRGPGIPENELDKIWITFHTTKSAQGHAGLGLPACRLILEHIGGRISAASQPGQGTTFTIDLPVYHNRETQIKIEPGRGNLLLIDDDDSWQHFATATLSKSGYKVTTSGKNYSVDLKNRFDLILIDDILTKEDSLEILRKIQEAGVIGKTVVVSSNPRVERTKECKLLGVQNLLPKPYTPVRLVNEVKNALSSIRQSQS